MIFKAATPFKIFPSREIGNEHAASWFSEIRSIRFSKQTENIKQTRSERERVADTLYLRRGANCDKMYKYSTAKNIKLYTRPHTKNKPGQTLLQASKCRDANS